MVIAFTPSGVGGASRRPYPAAGGAAPADAYAPARRLAASYAPTAYAVAAVPMAAAPVAAAPSPALAAQLQGLMAQVAQLNAQLAAVLAQPAAQPVARPAVPPAPPVAPPPPPPPPAPAPPPPPPPPAAPAPAARPAAKPAEKPATPASYTVRAGDSLSAIAARLLGDANRWRELYDLNRDVVGPNPNMIRPGQVLAMPGHAKPKPAPAPKPARTEGGPGQAPYISQYTPGGAAQGYTNGPSNCGPTSMAMIVRAFGYGGGMSDARLINHLGAAGGTTSAGTNVGGIAKMAAEAGLKAETRGPGAHVDWIADQLRAGKMVVANGDYFEMSPHRNTARTSGHYVAVVGVEADGTFLVNDPADKAVRRVSQADLARFIRSNPNGGYQIAIGR